MEQTMLQSDTAYEMLQELFWDYCTTPKKITHEGAQHLRDLINQAYPDPFIKPADGYMRDVWMSRLYQIPGYLEV
jgi:hypothetical protein